MIRLEPSWLSVVGDQFDLPYFQQLKQQLVAERQIHTVYPAGADIFRAFDLTPLDAVRVVIVGQDPYHGDHVGIPQAHGLAFSVPDGVPHPPSLVNIFKEITSSVGTPAPVSGDLSRWATQGILLLNSILTVRAHEAASHSPWGRQTFTDTVIARLCARRSGLIFLLWGAYAQSKQSLIDSTQHTILTAPHPSPLSAYRGFLGCGHFATVNEMLKARGEAEIVW